MEIKTPDSSDNRHHIGGCHSKQLSCETPGASSSFSLKLTSWYDGYIREHDGGHISGICCPCLAAPDNYRIAGEDKAGKGAPLPLKQQGGSSIEGILSISEIQGRSDFLLRTNQPLMDSSSKSRAGFPVPRNPSHDPPASSARYRERRIHPADG